MYLVRKPEFVKCEACNKGAQRTKTGTVYCCDKMKLRLFEESVEDVSRLLETLVDASMLPLPTALRIMEMKDILKSARPRRAKVRKPKLIHQVG